jgi:hypothetical protein
MKEKNMRRTARAVILVLAATSILLMSAKTDAASVVPSYLYDWDNGSNVNWLDDTDKNTLPKNTKNLDIQKTWTAWDSSSYYFRMDLAADPAKFNSGGYALRNYSIFIGPSSMTSFDPASFDEVIGTTYLGRNRISIYGMSLDGGGHDLDFLHDVDFNCTGSTLEWSISRADLGNDFTVWWGTFGNLRMIDQAGSTHVNSTPIPAAAWLLGSGLMGLMGLSRRRSAN